MNREDIIIAASKSNKGTRGNLQNPIELKLVQHGHGLKAIKIIIRNDVNDFKSKERWCYAYVKTNDFRRVYFFYGVSGLKGYKVQEVKSSNAHAISVTDSNLENDLFSDGKISKQFQWHFDDESKFYYIQF